jgi:hypothetical protein
MKSQTIHFFNKPAQIERVYKSNIWGEALFSLVLSYGYAITVARGKRPAAVCMLPAAGIACEIGPEGLQDKAGFLFQVQTYTAESTEALEKWLSIIDRAFKGEKVTLPILAPDPVDKELMKLDKEFLEACKGLLDPETAKAAAKEAMEIDGQIQQIFQGAQAMLSFGYERPEPFPLSAPGLLVPFMELGLKNGRNIERLLRAKNRLNLLENA